MSVILFIWATGLAAWAAFLLYGAEFAPPTVKFRSILIGLLFWPITLTKAIAMLRK